MNVKVISLAIGAAFLSGCLQSPATSYGVREGDKPATNLSEARDAVLNERASLAHEFYAAAHRQQPYNPEFAYFDSAAFLEQNEQVADGLRSGLKDFEPGKVLRGLKKMQSGIPPVLGVLHHTYKMLRTGLRDTFAPFLLGKNYQTPTYLSRADVMHFALDLQGPALFLELAQQINLDTVEVFDAKLDAIKDAVYKGDPECKNVENEHGSGSNQRECANRVLKQGLELLMTSKDPKVRSVFTIKDPMAVAQRYAMFTKLMLATQTEAEARKQLGEGERYLKTYINFRGENMECFYKACTLKFGDISIVMDVPGFFANFPSDFRRVMPRKFAIPADSERMLEGVELVDPTLGGLFPNGDLLEKARASELGDMLAMYFALVTAWAMPNEY